MMPQDDLITGFESHPKLAFKSFTKDSNITDTYNNKCSGYNLGNIIKRKTCKNKNTICGFENLWSKAIHNYTSCI